MAAESRESSMWQTLRQWCGSPRAAIRTVLQLDDSPHSIALGSAIGMWIALTPTPGIQMALVMAVAFATRPFFHWNRPAGLLMCYVSNPLTGVPILWTCFQVGNLFVESDVTFTQICNLMQPTAERPLWGQLRELMHDLGWPMLIGTLIVCTVSALLTYPVVFWLVAKYQKRDEGATSLDEAAGFPDGDDESVRRALNNPAAAAVTGTADTGTADTVAPRDGSIRAEDGPVAIPILRGGNRAADPCDAVISA